jgi:hypothetical protein
MTPTPTPTQAPLRSTVARRKLLLGAAAGLGLPMIGCGGGGGGGGSDGGSTGGGGSGGGGGAAGLTGYLVYRNSGVAAIYNFATKTELRFDPGTAPFINPGMTASAGKLITAALNGDERTYFDVGIFGLDAKLISTLRMRRELAGQRGAAVFNASGNRLVLSLDEETSPTNTNRIGRVLVLDMPSGKTVATIDGYSEPIWLGTTGELLVRNAEDEKMYVVAADLRTITRLGNLTSSTKLGAYNATADGRYIVYSDNVSESTIYAYDRTSGTSWVAASDRISGLTSPVVSPDGKFMAVYSRVRLATVPHVISFGVNVTVAVDDQYALSNTIAECGGRMGWCA